MMQSGKGRILLRAVLPTCPRPLKAGAFSVHGPDEQIFGVNGQILGQDQSDQGASACRGGTTARGCSGDSRDHPWDRWNGYQCFNVQETLVTRLLSTTAMLLSLTTLVVTPASAQGIYMGRDGRVHSSGIVQPPKQAPAPHSLMPESYRKAAESTFKQEAQRRADLEAQNQAYVPPPPAPNSTRLPRDNKLDYHYVTSGYPLPMTSGNGCGGIGIVAITEAERIAGEQLANTGPTGLRTLSNELRQRMVYLYSEYMRARYIGTSALAYDPSDLFVPNMEKLSEEKIRECLPTVSKLIDNYRKKQEELRQAEAEAIRVANLPSSRIVNAYRLYTMVKYCNQVREGYLVKYVNDVEMERAEVVIRAIVNKAKSEDPSVDTDKLWSQAQQATNGQMASQSYCEMYYNQLLHMSPVSPYNIRKPT